MSETPDEKAQSFASAEALYARRDINKRITDLERRVEQLEKYINNQMYQKYGEML